MFVLTFAFFSLSATAQPKNLTKHQMRTLNKKLSAQVRNFLQTADKLEIITDTIQEPVTEKPVYKPNKSYVIKNAGTRKKVLDLFYWDLALGGGDAACYYPNHSIIARKGRKTLNIDICYTCHKFVVSGSFGGWQGGMWGEPRSEELIDRLIDKYGAPYKRP